VAIGAFTGAGGYLLGAFGPSLLGGAILIAPRHGILGRRFGTDGVAPDGGTL